MLDMARMKAYKAGEVATKKQLKNYQVKSNRINRRGF